MCYSARGMHWQEAVPCSGRNAWREMGHSISRSSITFICHHRTQGVTPAPPLCQDAAPPQQPPRPPPTPAPSHPHAPAGPPGSTRPSSCPGQPRPSPPGAGSSSARGRPWPHAARRRRRSRRALHRLPALAEDAGTCSPAMPEPDNMWSSLIPPRPMPFIPTQLVCRARASPGTATPAQRRVGKGGIAQTPRGKEKALPEET